MTQTQFRERRGKLNELDRAFDLDFWQAQPAEARFDAAWELIVHYAKVKGLDVRQLRLSDSLENFRKQRGYHLFIGGYAVIQHAEPRFTKDLDLWISTDTENATAVYNSLRQFGAPLEGLTEADFSEDGYFYQMGSPPVRVDVLMGIPGVEFSEAWERRVDVMFDDLPVTFISRADLKNCGQSVLLPAAHKI